MRKSRNSYMKKNHSKLLFQTVLLLINFLFLLACFSRYLDLSCVECVSLPCFACTAHLFRMNAGLVLQFLSICTVTFLVRTLGIFLRLLIC